MGPTRLKRNFNQKIKKWKTKNVPCTRTGYNLQVYFGFFSEVSSDHMSLACKPNLGIFKLNLMPAIYLKLLNGKINSIPPEIIQENMYSECILIKRWSVYINLRKTNPVERWYLTNTTRSPRTLDSKRI